MNYFKYIIVISICLLLFVISYSRLTSYTFTSPDNQYHLFEVRLRRSFADNNLDLHQLLIEPHLQQCTLEIIDTKTPLPIQATFSTSKDPYFQVNVLQQLSRMARNKNKAIKYIDLAINHPYATLQDI